MFLIVWTLTTQITFSLFLTLGPFPGAAKQNAGDQVEPTSGTDCHPLKH